MRPLLLLSPWQQMPRPCPWKQHLDAWPVCLHACMHLQQMNAALMLRTHSARLHAAAAR
jgi:hypothetical protein